MKWLFETSKEETHVYVDGYDCLIKAMFAMVSDMYVSVRGNKRYKEILANYKILTETEKKK